MGKWVNGEKVKWIKVEIGKWYFCNKINTGV